MATSALRLMGSLLFMLSGQAVVTRSDARGARGAEAAPTGPERSNGAAERSNRRVQGACAEAWLMHQVEVAALRPRCPQTAPAIAGALANSPLGPSDHTNRRRLAMAAPARIKGSCLSALMAQADLCTEEEMAAAEAGTLY